MNFMAYIKKLSATCQMFIFSPWFKFAYDKDFQKLMLNRIITSSRHSFHFSKIYCSFMNTFQTVVQNLPKYLSSDLLVCCT